MSLTRKIIYILLLIPFLFKFSIINALETNNRFYFSYLKNTDKLISNDIFAISSDSQGFTWIGSANGLYRYDGYDLVEVKNNEEHVRVSGIIPDSKNGLWIAANGLQYLDTRTFQFTSFAIGENNEIRTIYNHGNQIWIGTEGGLVQFNKQTHSVKIFTAENSKLSNNIVRAVFKSKNGDLWVGTSDKLNCLKKGSSTFESFDVKGAYKPEISYNHILDIKPYSKNKDSLLWIGTETGLCLFNTNTKTGQAFNVSNTKLSNDAVKCIHHADNEKLWLGTDFGLNLFDTETGSSNVFLHQPDKQMSIVDNVIWSVFEDNAGIIWFGTSNGISRINTNKNSFEYLPVRSEQNGFKIGDVVKSIVPVDNQNVWIATNHGASLYNLERGITESLNTREKGVRKLGFDKIQALYTDSDNRLWIGSVGGIFVWNAQKGSMHKITSENENAKSLKSNYINKFITAPDSSFFVSIWQRGFYRMSGNFNAPEELNVELVLDINSDLIVAGRKYLWIVDENLLLRYNPSNNSVDTVNLVNKAVADNYIRSLYYSSNGKLWLGGENAIFEYSPENNQISIHEIESQQQIIILSFEEDLAGNLWMSSQKSIFKFDYRNKKTQAFILGNEYLLNGFIPGCSAKTKDGKIFFGGNDGMILFNPTEIEKSSYSPELVISGLKIYNKNIWAGDEIMGNNKLNKNITYLDKIELPYKTRSFSISFSSLHFGAPEKNVYSYQLEGFDNNWHTLSEANSVGYSGLTPGKYTFRVKGTNNEGVWQEQETQIGVRILPPLWMRWYFITAILLLLTGITATILYFFFQKRKLTREVQMEQAEKRNIAALNRAKLQFFTNISHEFRTPLSLIVGPVKKLSNQKVFNNESREMVALISKNADRMLRLVNQLMDFRKISSNVSSAVKTENDLIDLVQDTFELFVENAKEKQLHFIFQSNCEKAIFEFDKPKLETVLFNLLSNAFKFTQHGEIKIRLQWNKKAETMEIVVSDTGKGISQEKQAHIFHRFYRAEEQEHETGTGIGLNIVKEFVELHQGKIHVESKPGEGSSFKVILPVKNTRFEILPGELWYDIVSDISEDKKEKPQQSYITESNTGKTILVVEDNIEMASFITGCLKPEYRVFIENNGTDGVKKAAKIMPELIISDVMMPLKSGIELCNELKNNINTSHIPIVLLTALDTFDHKKEGYYTGADDYITKPFDEELLLARITGLLKNREVMQQNFQLQKTIDPAKLEIGNPDQDFLNKLMQIIEDNIHKRDLNTSLLTQELGMSRSVVYNKLKALTGQSIIEFVRDFKLKRAAQLISEHGFSVTDACYKVGFSDRRYFTKVFKQRFGKSPSDYKKRVTD